MTDSNARVAIDIGGTFTDVVLAHQGRRHTTKVLTTYQDPALAVMAGLQQVLQAAALTPASVALILHGTTLATNALIERRGARTALITTEGHRDVLEMALENRFEQYDISIDRPAPLVPRALRLPVAERMDAAGRVLLPLDETAVRALVPVLRATGVESVAIGFLHAYANAAHEQRAAAVLAEACPDLALSLSSEVCPEIREYERLSTTCANAYVKPLMSRYLASFAARLRADGYHCPLLLMTSGGGLTDLATASALPVRLVESGPAGGALLAARVAAQCGLDRVLSFDMGGTTAKICLIDDAAPLVSRAFEVGRVYRFRKGSGLPVRIPVIEMVEIGAGGGSLAHVDALRRIQVGPESAASEPGPACYGRGGMHATVTDADVLLGHVPAEYFAGGLLRPDSVSAAEALRRDVAEPLGLDVPSAAYSVAAVVDENMAAAARAHAAEWGADLAGRTLIAFGGAGPLHAAALAVKLGIDRVLVPAHAGVGSAVGFLDAPVRFEVVRSRYQRLSRLDAAQLESTFATLHQEALAVVRQAASSASDSETEWRVTRRLAMRYLGQGYEISVTLNDALLDMPPVDEAAHDRDARLRLGIRAAFDRQYVQLYGRLIPDLDVEVLSLSLAVTAPARMEDDLDAEASAPAESLFSDRTLTDRPGTDIPLADRMMDAASVAGPNGDHMREFVDPLSGAITAVPVIDRRRVLASALLSNRGTAPTERPKPVSISESVSGPLLVAEAQTTTVVPGGFTVRALPGGHLLLERRAVGDFAATSASIGADGSVGQSFQETRP